ncbi:MAG: DNA starvation/stationary phase protection protein [Deltaproteobacteria bacterium]|nr:DNA starvation/stationary phase protection protein [Deltaproteobacteria bacterium]
MKPKIGLSDPALKGVVDILNTVLADEFVLYTETLNYHWNVTGAHFHDLHTFLDSQYKALLDNIDDIAERVRSLGGVATGSLSEFLKQTRLKEKSAMQAQAMLENLLSDHEALIQSLRKDLQTCDQKFHDMGTNDFLTGLMEKHEKMAWMLRACLQKSL